MHTPCRTCTRFRALTLVACGVVAALAAGVVFSRVKAEPERDASVLATLDQAAWGMPTAQELARYSGRSVPEHWQRSRQLLRTAVLQARWAPPAGTRWTYIALKADPVQALHENYLYAEWQRGGVRFRAKVWSTWYRILVEPASVPDTDVLRAAIARGKAYWHSRPKPTSQEREAFRSVIGRFLRVTLPPPTGPDHIPWQTSVRGDAQGEAVLSTTCVPGLRYANEVRLTTDGRAIAFMVGRSELDYDRLCLSEYKAPAHPRVKPLNPSLIELVDTHRYSNYHRTPDGAGWDATVTAGPKSRCFVMIRFLHSWEYNTEGRHDPVAKTDVLVPRYYLSGRVPKGYRFGYSFDVRSPSGAIARRTWEACEFAALTTEAIHGGQVFTVRNSFGGLITDFRPTDTSRLKQAYDCVVSWYSKIRVPKDARPLYAEAKELLRQYALRETKPDCRAETKRLVAEVKNYLEHDGAYSQEGLSTERPYDLWQEEPARG